jgi:hypothetical protein
MFPQMLKKGSFGWEHMSEKLMGKTLNEKVKTGFEVK